MILDELFQREIDELMFTGNLEDPSEYRSGMYKGAKIFLELMGDKKFTLEDMMNCWNKALTFQTHKETLGEHIQSQKQKGWDVEILEECLDKNCDGINRKGECISTGKPKLDENGCLILKKI